MLNDLKVLVLPRDERMRELISLQALGLTPIESVRYYLAFKMADKGLVSAPNAAVGAPFQIGGQPPVGFYNVTDETGLAQVTSVFDDIHALEKIAVNLFYGWGYNFYRLENQLRADDQTVRAKVGWLLGRAREAVEQAEGAWRRANLPPPTREKPRPDPAAVEAARNGWRRSRARSARWRGRSAPIPSPKRTT